MKCVQVETAPRVLKTPVGRGDRLRPHTGGADRLCQGPKVDEQLGQLGRVTYSQDSLGGSPYFACQ